MESTKMSDQMILDLQGRVSRLEGDAVRRAELQALENRLERVESQLDGFRDDLSEIKADLKAILARDQGRQEGAAGVAPGGMTAHAKTAALGAGGAGILYALYEVAQAILTATGKG